MTLKELINKKNNDAAEIDIILIKDKEEALLEIYYEGKLADIPEQYMDKEIKNIGRSLKAEEEGKAIFYISI